MLMHRKVPVCRISTALLQLMYMIDEPAFPVLRVSSRGTKCNFKFCRKFLLLLSL